MVSAALAASLLVLDGCAVEPAADDDETDTTVTATVSNPLSSSAIGWLNGTYTNCVSRSGAWSARVAGVATMDNPALTVVKNDASCVLTLTGLVADQSYVASVSLPLSTSYATTPSTFAAGGVSFLVNARLETGSFGSDFQISFVYGGDTAPPSTAADAVSGGYASVQSTTASTIVLPPTYTMDTSGLRFQVTLAGLVFTLTGQAVLLDGVVTGSSYVIDGGTLGATPTYAQTAAAYNAAVLTQKTITGANPVIAASELGAGGVSLIGATQVRSVIVKRTSAGIAAYQILRVTFVF